MTNPNDPLHATCSELWIAYKLAHLYHSTTYRAEFVDEAFKLKQNEVRFTIEILGIIWDSMDALTDINGSSG